MKIVFFIIFEVGKANGTTLISSGYHLNVITWVFITGGLIDFIILLFLIIK